jgi:hypothetical protein
MRQTSVIMRRLPFLIYCVLAWEVGLFEPLLSVNLLMFGAAFVIRWHERRAGNQPNNLGRRYLRLEDAERVNSRRSAGIERVASAIEWTAVSESMRRLPARIDNKPALLAGMRRLAA